MFELHKEGCKPETPTERRARIQRTWWFRAGRSACRELAPLKFWFLVAWWAFWIIMITALIWGVVDAIWFPPDIMN